MITGSSHHSQVDKLMDVIFEGMKAGVVHKLDLPPCFRETIGAGDDLPEVAARWSREFRSRIDAPKLPPRPLPAPPRQDDDMGIDAPI